MTQRAKLELPINKPVEIELLYDEPITGASQYGKYFMYAVRSDGMEYSFFVTEEANDQLKQLHKGDTAIITKLATQQGNKLITAYEVKPIGVKERVLQQEIASDLPDESPSHDHFFEVMLQCYREALEISRELNGMADPEKIAVTLFIARSKKSY
jgi:hypothetical protein